MIGNKERISLSLFLFGVLIGTILMASNSFVFKKENEELKIQNHKLEQKLLKLYEEQAEQTKRTAEKNGIGG